MRIEMKEAKAVTTTYRMLAGVAVAALIAVAGGAAVAQVSPEGGPVQVTADTWKTDNTTHTTYLDGRVEIQQQNARLRSDHAKILSAADGSIINITADGNVYYVTKDTKGQDNIMKGDNAVYTEADDTMVVTGGPVILQQGQNVMTGTRLVSHIKAGDSTLDAAPTDAGKGRVRGVFYPQKNGENPQAVKVPPSVKPAGQ
jgi:lipopolysaccharide export system protein LptA